MSIKTQNDAIRAYRVFSIDPKVREIVRAHKPATLRWFDEPTGNLYEAYAPYIWADHTGRELSHDGTPLGVGCAAWRIVPIQVSYGDKGDVMHIGTDSADSILHKDLPEGLRDAMLLRFKREQHLAVRCNPA